MCGPITRRGSVAALAAPRSRCGGRGRGRSGSGRSARSSTSCSLSAVQCGVLGLRLEEPEPLGVLDQEAHRRRALDRDRLAVLVDVVRVAALEDGRPGEARVGDAVVERHARRVDLVAGVDAGPEEPPLVAAEEHVRAGDVALDRPARAPWPRRSRRRTTAARRSGRTRSAAAKRRRSAAGSGSSSPAPSAGCRSTATGSFSRSPAIGRPIHRSTSLVSIVSSTPAPIPWLSQKLLDSRHLVASSRPSCFRCHPLESACVRLVTWPATGQQLLLPTRDLAA